jgi:hypothetical protein
VSDPKLFCPTCQDRLSDAEDEITTLRAEVERLTRERDEYRTAWRKRDEDALAFASGAGIAAERMIASQAEAGALRGAMRLILAICVEDSAPKGGIEEVAREALALSAQPAATGEGALCSSCGGTRLLYTGQKGNLYEPCPACQPAATGCPRCLRGDHSAHGPAGSLPPNGCMWCKCGHEAGCPCAGCNPDKVTT